jgi:hypothetical protein
MEFRESSLRVPTLSLLILMAWGTVAQANDASDIKALHTKLGSALLKCDAGALRKMEGPGFYAQEGNKRVNSAQFEAQLKQRAAYVQGHGSGSVQVSRIEIKGKKATVTSTYKFEGPMPTQPGSRPGVVHTFGMTGIMDTTLVKSARGWLFTSMNQRFGTALIDGRPFNGGPPPGGPMRGPRP